MNTNGYSSYLMGVFTRLRLKIMFCMNDFSKKNKFQTCIFTNLNVRIACGKAESAMIIGGR